MRQKNKLLKLPEIVQGLLRGSILMLGGLLLLAIFTTLFYDFMMNILDYLLIGSYFLILGYMGCYTAHKASQNGWLHGSVTGLIFMGILLILCSSSLEITLSNIFILLVIAMITGGVGGIIGINLS